MPINTPHPEHSEHVARWQLVRDAVEGQHEIHEAGERYLPRLKDQTNEDYAAYKGRAGWYGATGRTLQGMVGMVFRRAAVVEVPAGMDAVIADATLRGESIHGVARTLMGEQIAVGRAGILVEYPQAAGTEGETLAQAQAAGRRPYLALYQAEHIVNWREARIGGRVQPVLIVLKEEADAGGADPYAPGCVEQYRELSLTPAGYVQRLFRKDARGDWVQFGGDIVPTINGAPLTSIPWVTIGPESLTLAVQKAPLEDLACVNVGHYRNTADLEHGAHFAGLPTPVITGYTAPEGEKLYIGSAAAWVFPDPAARAAYLEFTGQGLEALEKRCAQKEAQMAALGARMLAPEKSGVEAADTLSNRHAGEHSVLAGYANLVSEALTRALKLCAQWMGIDPTPVRYALNTDYMPAGMSAQQLTALVAAWQSGAISWPTLFDNLKRGELIAADVDADKEQSRLDTAAPVLPGRTQPGVPR